MASKRAMAGLPEPGERAEPDRPAPRPVPHPSVLPEQVADMSEGLRYERDDVRGEHRRLRQAAVRLLAGATTDERYARGVTLVDTAAVEALRRVLNGE